MSQKKENRKVSEKLKKQFASEIIAGDLFWFAGLREMEN